MPSFSSGRFARAGEGDAIAVRGFEQIQHALSLVGDEAQAELRRRLAEIGAKVALVAASNAPRRTGELATSIRDSVQARSASIYSTAIYGGVQNVGAWKTEGRGPHVSRTRASHYMDRTVEELAPWVAEEVQKVVDWALSTFENG